MFREQWTAKWSSPTEYEQLLDDYAAILVKLTPEQIKRGLDASLGRQFPPSPSEFFGLARQRATSSPAHQLFKALPRPPRDPAALAARVADIRRALARPTQDTEEPRDRIDPVEQ